MSPTNDAREVPESVDTTSVADGDHVRLIQDLCGTETLLLVDDDAMFRELLIIALRAYGYTVVDGANGEDALRAAARFDAPIHLVLTDVVMPHADGRDLVGTLRGWYPGIRVLFMSGYARGEMAVRDVVDSDTDFIRKPFHLNTLVTRVRALLDAHPARALPSSSGHELAVTS
jgi:two-component system, cell cycle sensor histidine kinase and response regulator CckA